MTETINSIPKAHPKIVGQQKKGRKKNSSRGGKTLVSGVQTTKKK